MPDKKISGISSFYMRLWNREAAESNETKRYDTDFYLTFMDTHSLVSIFIYKWLPN